jgi:hypothetical protein
VSPKVGNSVSRSGKIKQASTMPAHYPPTRSLNYNGRTDLQLKGHCRIGRGPLRAVGLPGQEHRGQAYPRFRAYLTI